MKKIISFGASLLLPVVTFAQNNTTVANNQTQIGDIFGWIANIITKLFPIMVGIAVLVFFFEIIMFILNKDNKDKQDGFKKGILMSLLAIFVMLAFFGIIKVIANTLGIGGTVGASIGAQYIPTVQLQ